MPFNGNGETNDSVVVFSQQIRNRAARSDVKTLGRTGNKISVGLNSATQPEQFLQLQNIYHLYSAQERNRKK